ncbi:MAG: hypothetical protein WKG01_05415 [Kofleriaceae bacterium]
MPRPLSTFTILILLAGVAHAEEVDTSLAMPAETTESPPPEGGREQPQKPPAPDGAPAPPAPPASSEPAMPAEPPATLPVEELAPAPAAATQVSALDRDDGALAATERVVVDTDPGDQGIGATIGMAVGGRVTPGGLRITGHYLYQLSSQDWFDGTASFTFGGGDAACFRDRMDVTSCGHGVNDGNSIELAAGIRRMFAARGAFRPYARAAIGLSYVRFGSDDVSGLAIPLHAGGGVRAHVAPGVAVIGQAELMLGFGGFSRGLGAEPQLGMAVTAGAEFRLR